MSGIGTEDLEAWGYWDNVKQKEEFTDKRKLVDDLVNIFTNPYPTTLSESYITETLKTIQKSYFLTQNEIKELSDIIYERILNENSK